MAAYYRFLQTPQAVPRVDTKYRQISSKIPAPDSLEILHDLDRLESRAMHNQLPVVWDRADNFLVYDGFGNCWIDFTSTVLVANVGHANTEVLSALQDFLQKPLLHSYNFPTKIRRDFLQKLVELMPRQLEKALLVSSGTEAIERALKLLRLNGLASGPRRTAIISFQGAMHGRTMGAELLSGQPHPTWISATDPKMYFLPFPTCYDADASGQDWEQLFYSDMEKLYKLGLKLDELCGFIVESYCGWGPVFFPKEYIRTLSNFASRNNVPLCIDEIQGGMGRTGRLMSHEHYEIDADLVCFGKGITSSLPLSAVVGRSEIIDRAPYAMSSTHSGNPLSCAAGLANLNYLHENRLIERAECLGAVLHNKLLSLQRRFSKRIKHTDNKGLLGGIFFSNPQSGAPDNIFASRLCERAMQKGLLLIHTGKESVKIGPPLTIDKDALLEGMEVVGEAIEELEQE